MRHRPSRLRAGLRAVSRVASARIRHTTSAPPCDPEALTERFGALRAHLHGAPSWQSWFALCHLVEWCGEHAPERCAQEWTPYVMRGLERWPSRWRVCPERWVARVLRHEPLPALTLIHHMHLTQEQLRAGGPARWLRTGRTHHTAQQIARAVHHPSADHLRTLTLTDVDLSGELLRALLSTPASARLEALNTSSVLLPDALPLLGRMPALRTVRVGGFWGTLEELLASPARRPLEHLHIQRFRASAPEHGNLLHSDLLTRTSLADRLTIGALEGDDDEVLELLQHAPQLRPERAVIRATGARTLQALCAHEAMSQTETLELHMRAPGHLSGRIEHATALRHVRIHGSSDARLLALFAPALERLRIDARAWDADELSALFDWTNDSALETLQLDHVRADALTHTTGRFTRLRHLALTHSALDSETLARWLREADLRALTHLDLSHNQLTDEGFHELLDAARDAAWRVLTLRGNPLSLAGLERLREVRGALREVHISAPAYDPNTRQRLHALGRAASVQLVWPGDASRRRRVA